MKTRVYVAMVVLLAFCAGYYLALRLHSAQKPPEVDAVVWPRWPPLQPFSLIDSRGNPFSEQRLVGKWTLLFFGYTYCPDICPTTMLVLRKASALLGEFVPFADRGQVLFVSVDASRDTPEQLRAYAAHFDPDFLAATAPMEQLRELLQQFGATVARVSGGDESEYWFEHPAAVYLISPDLRLSGLFLPPLDPAAIAQQAREIISYGESER